MNYRYDITFNNKPFQIYVEEVEGNSYEHHLVYKTKHKGKYLISTTVNDYGKHEIDGCNESIVEELKELEVVNDIDNRLNELPFQFKFYGRTWNLTYGTTPCSELPDSFPTKEEYMASLASVSN